MRFQLVFGLIALLLVACDKQKERVPSQEEGGAERGGRKVIRDSRTSRKERADAPEDPRMAFTFAQHIENPAERDKALASVAWSVVESDSELTREAIEAMSVDSPDRVRLIQHIAMRQAEQDPAAALAWADAFGSEMEVAAAKCQIALVLAESDPQRAAELISESGIEGRELEVAAVGVIQRWAANSPGGAAAWVAAFPAGQAREAGIRSVVATWMKADAQAAFGWMATLSDQDVRKEAALAMSETLLQQPESVREKWLSHANPQIRSEIDAEGERALKNVGDNIPPPPKGSAD